MKAILDDRQRKHDPQNFMANGVISRSPEQPARIDVLKSGAQAAGYAFAEPKDAGLGPIAAIHTAEYLSFLKTIHARWTRIDGAAPEVIPNIHPANRTDSYPKSAIGQAGYHQADTACPISEHTWLSAYWSAQTAITGADLVSGGENNIYALCRPPGHHAFTDLAGGFCFLNNAAIAAERLRQKGHRPAILDVDVHHGNGTQGIFYRRGDVLTVSIHADPARFYPFFWGHAHERGEGEGLGANFNLPLQRGTGDDDYIKALDIALARVADFGADILVVALGLDASIDDPFQGLAITYEGFRRIGDRLRNTGLLLLLVQEGGYLSETLGDNLNALLKA
ncbi:MULTISPECIES: histone deacetylase family protein [Marivita]|uniref:Histone deacetylase family protein n=1 Tax=Marivita cryptomonadis TaxID=505252 RepID=A0A9Q2RZ81_9RHOB|nr:MULTISPECIES: histone deacetylase family protein [Marivita]MCR9168717.1 histone deacetylase family protein [Paracoccaceae bacterium]MBM2321006.1 histone deacetylase family protein [Marivita cryptomonadis]MBM2330587.1 histone deacetylase family protein [Marivita cryptomonadis]MBM2340173.1 histone deacetylase family protein [Marivita cryptomonadis]MBM2344835.1 histone deacetylase family protein [Marivita cryptomonadis]